MAANWLESRGKGRGRAELRLDVLIHNHVDPTACTAQLPVVPPAPLSQDENCVCLFPRTDSIPQQKKSHGMHAHEHFTTHARDGFPYCRRRVVGIYLSRRTFLNRRGDVNYYTMHIPC
jgi:hypothetical protein